MDWTREELLAYLLIYCMKADLDENKTEVEWIEQRVGKEVYEKMYAACSTDNDYTRIQNIQKAMKVHEMNEKEVDDIFFEMNSLFQIDQHVDIMENNLLRGLKHVLK
jgi:hypothetical protein